MTGGRENVASSPFTWDAPTVSGGYKNIAQGLDSSVSGGRENHALGMQTSISGGYNNTIHDGWYSSISGGTGWSLILEAGPSLRGEQASITGE